MKDKYSAQETHALLALLASNIPEVERQAIVETLHGRDSVAVYEECVPLFDGTPRQQRDACTVVAQLRSLRVDKERFVEATAKIASKLDSRDAGVRTAAAYALGHLALDDDAFDQLLLAHVGDPDTNVRTGVAFALGRAELGASIGALSTLASDAESKVRDMAVFSLSQKADLDLEDLTTEEKTELAESLAKRLDDLLRIRVEAISGLLKLADTRARDAVLASIRDGSEDLYEVYVDVAIAFPDIRFCELLSRYNNASAEVLVKVEDARRLCGCAAI